MSRFVKIMIAVLAAMSAGTVLVFSQTVTTRTVTFETRSSSHSCPSRDFWKAERLSVHGGLATPSYTAAYFAEGSLWDGFDSWYDSSKRLSDIYADYNGLTRSSGAFVLGADYMFARWFSISADLSASFVWHDAYDGVSREWKGTKTGAVLCFIPQARLIFLNRPSVRLYGKFGLGVAAYLGFDCWVGDWNDDGSTVAPAFQYVPFGIEVGKKIFGFAEFGVGTTYSGIFAGVGYKF